jgi:hypothetical protein
MQDGIEFFQSEIQNTSCLIQSFHPSIHPFILPILAGPTPLHRAQTMNRLGPLLVRLCLSQNFCKVAQSWPVQTLLGTKSIYVPSNFTTAQLSMPSSF